MEVRGPRSDELGVSAACRCDIYGGV